MGWRSLEIYVYWRKPVWAKFFSKIEAEIHPELKMLPCPLKLINFQEMNIKSFWWNKYQSKHPAIFCLGCSALLESPHLPSNPLYLKYSSYEEGKNVSLAEQHPFCWPISWDLWLSKNVFALTFLPGGINTGAAISSIPAAIKIIPLVSQNRGQLAPLTIFFRPCLPHS